MARLGYFTNRLRSRHRIVAAVLLGWIALVVMSAGSTASGDNFFRLPDLRGFFIAVVLVLAISGLVILILVVRSEEGVLAEKRPPKSPLSLLVITAIIVVLMLALNPDLVFEPPVAESSTPTPPPVDSTVPVDEQQPARLGSRLLLIAAGLGAGAVLLWSRHRQPGPDAVAPAVSEDELDLAIADAIADATNLLESDEDPRRSVLAAYASFENSLRDQGRARSRTETPTEHLQRVLRRFPTVSAPAIRLGQLYELARFSDHPISTADREQALEALRSARTALLGEKSQQL